MKIVYVPGLEMPKRCNACPMFIDYLYGCRLYSYGIPARYDCDTEVRPDWCELKEIEVSEEVRDGN